MGKHYCGDELIQRRELWPSEQREGWWGWLTANYCPRCDTSSASARDIEANVGTVLVASSGDGVAS